MTNIKDAPIDAKDWEGKKGKLNQIGTLGKDNQANRVYSTDGISKTLDTSIFK